MRLCWIIDHMDGYIFTQKSRNYIGIYLYLNRHLKYAPYKPADFIVFNVIIRTIATCYKNAAQTRIDVILLG